MRENSRILCLLSLDSRVINSANSSLVAQLKISEPSEKYIDITNRKVCFQNLTFLGQKKYFVSNKRAENLFYKFAFKIKINVPKILLKNGCIQRFFILELAELRSA